jgi:hypothetical protein
MFNQIMQWAHKATILHNHDFRIFPQNRQKVVNDLYRKFDMKGLEPKEMDFCMPGSGETVKIIYHNIHEVIYSLLQDKDLMQPANLLFDGDDPFHKDVNSTARSSLFRDVNDGAVFRNAVKLYCKIPDRDVLCPVIFFIDKTHTDLHGNLCLEPVAMTLAIFNRATRNKASAWRTIGYCVNHSNCSTTSPLQKAQDFHSVLTVLGYCERAGTHCQKQGYI